MYRSVDYPKLANDIWSDTEDRMEETGEHWEDALYEVLDSRLEGLSAGSLDYFHDYLDREVHHLMRTDDDGRNYEEWTWMERIRDAVREFYEEGLRWTVPVRMEQRLNGYNFTRIKDILILTALKVMGLLLF